MKQAEHTLRELLQIAGVKLDGSGPADPQVHDKRLYKRIFAEGSLGIGESYMDGWWDCQAIDELYYRLHRAELDSKIGISWPILKTYVRAKVSNRQSKSRSKDNASAHYDIGNDLYKLMLDTRMVYSCGYWQDAKNLDEAQTAKLDLICKKLHLKPGMEVLDIGCGWGGFAEFAARNYGVHVTGISPAAEQVKEARQRTKGLSVKIYEKSYQQLDETKKFDAVVSIGMLEHVGNKNWPEFFALSNRLLKDDGIMLHHTIGSNQPSTTTDPWVDKYIFPGGVVPSLSQLTKILEGQKLIVEDVHNFGLDYDKTLMAWWHNFDCNYHLIKHDYDERFYRMWRFYLLHFAGMFRARNLNLWQIVIRKKDQTTVYTRV